MLDQEGCATPESRRYGVNPSGDINVQLVNVNGTEPNRQGGIKERMVVDRGRGVYVLKADKESKDELKRKKVDRRFVPGRKRMDRRQAGVASKDQIQQTQTGRLSNRKKIFLGALYKTGLKSFKRGGKPGEMSFIGRKIFKQLGGPKRKVSTLFENSARFELGQVVYKSLWRKKNIYIYPLEHTRLNESFYSSYQRNIDIYIIYIGS